MSSTTKAAAVPAARRKSFKPTKMVTLKLSSKLLQQFAPAQTSIKGETPASKESNSTALDSVPPASSTPNGDNATGSNADTPVAAGTPSSSMPPPTEVVKKKGGRRSTAAPVDPNAPPKVRGKPGPKKKARLEDGSIDHSAPVPRAANAHKLGPRANQGAINAGLRALDRSGKPCRKWAKGEFKMKSFTGVVWDLPRWKAPPKTSTDGTPDGQSAASDSSKENKDNSQQDSVKSEKSNNGGDVEMGNTPGQNAASPASSLPSAPSLGLAAPTTVSTSA